LPAQANVTRQLPLVLSLNSRLRTGGEETFQALVPECLDRHTL
jgi:hypothetical protein